MLKLYQIIGLVALSLTTQIKAEVFPGADETTPARAQYFSWINNTNEGATEEQTLINLEFFDWLHQDYGMQLDIYAFDAGAIDGKRWYGSTKSEKFKQQFPSGFDPIYKRAKEMDVRLGIWGGPDGFGETEQDAKERIEMMVSLCDKYDFELFKFDTVAGDLRDDKQDAFVEMMTRCREFSPSLIFLNHRINLGDKALPHATTFLWEGKETYIDVHMFNESPALHHRAGALARGLPPKLSRLTEDHGVCLSSALDYWDDELVLQAFNRSLILSPQIYCNPWLLNDDEFPKLARIFNLAKQHKDLLVNGLELPKKQYGPFALSRGDSGTRLITLRNLSWEPKTYTLRLNSGIGIEPSNSKFEVRRYHPSETVYGRFDYDEKVEISVAPFRSTLLRVTNTPDIGISGIDYEVLSQDVSGRADTFLLLGEPGVSYPIKLHNSESIQSATVDGEPIDINGETAEIRFEGNKIQADRHKFLGKMRNTKFPEDAESLYETTVFAADNNALEVRSLKRSGPTKHMAVQKARDAFFNQPLFTDRAIWDRNLFDGDFSTAFSVMKRWSYWWNNDPDTTINDGGFRLDLGKVELLDSIVLHTRDETTLQPAKLGEGVIAEVSTDLRSWTEIRFLAGNRMELKMPSESFPVRYLRIKEDSPHWISEVEAYQNKETLDRTNWRASNLFGNFERMKFTKAWQLNTRLNNIAPDSYLAIAVEGETGNEGVYAAIRIDGELVGASDRAPSYPANTWELQVKPVSGNYTYYIPLKPQWQNKNIEVVLLGGNKARKISSSVWLTRKPTPLVTKKLVLSKR